MLVLPSAVTFNFATVNSNHEQLILFHQYILLFIIVILPVSQLSPHVGLGYFLHSPLIVEAFSQRQYCIHLLIQGLLAVLHSMLYLMQTRSLVDAPGLWLGLVH